MTGEVFDQVREEAHEPKQKPGPAAAEAEARRTPKAKEPKPPKAGGTAWQDPQADERATELLRAVPGGYAGFQVGLQVVLDDTDSLSPFDAPLRKECGRLGDALAAHGKAQKSVTCITHAFNTSCNVVSVERGKFTMPEMSYVSGTYLKPALRKTASATKSFVTHVGSEGGVVRPGVTLVVGDAQFFDWETAGPLIPAWRAFMERHGQIPVMATCGEVHDGFAMAVGEGGDLVVDLEAFGLEALFQTLADSIVSSLGGRDLKSLLKKAFADAKKK